MSTEKRLLVLGAGGLGGCVAEMAKDAGYEKIAFLDDSLRKGTYVLEYPVLGRVTEAPAFRMEYSCAIAAIGNNSGRLKLIQMLDNAGFEIPFLIHKTAYVSPSAQIGKGCIIRAHAAVEQRTRLEEGCLINMGALIDHDCVIGQGSHVHMGCMVRNASRIDSMSVLEPNQVVQ